MNTTPDSPEAWRTLHRHAAAQLPADFADRVLRTLRTQTAAAAHSTAGQILLAACTAAACLVIVVLVHTHNIQKTNQEALANWQQISTQADLFASVP
jgi:hypothetical protein